MWLLKKILNRRFSKYGFFIFSGLYYVLSRLTKMDFKKESNLKVRSGIRWGRIFVFLFWAVILFLVWAFWFVKSGYASEFEGKIDGCAVVFGAAVWKDDVPSHALNDRLQSAIKLYKEERVNCLIMTGGESTFGSHEVDVMTKVAVDAGIPTESISQDYLGENTLISVSNIDKEKPVVLVSNDFHLARIGLLAYQNGIKNYHLHKADYLKGEYRDDDYYYFREVAGVLLFASVGWFM